MWVNQGGANAYTSTVRHNGAFEMRFLCWAFWQGAKSREAKADPLVAKALAAVNVRDWLQRMPIKRGGSPLALIPKYEAWAFDLATRGDYDQFWEHPGFNIERNWPRHADVPMVFSSGWYDSYTRANMENFAGLRRLKRGPVQAIMGPWTHGFTQLGLTYSGDVDFGPDAAIDYNEARLEFFDAVLKGGPNGWRDRPPVRLFIMGGGSGGRNGAGRLEHGGRWRDEQEWPLARTRFVDFYLHPGGNLTTGPPETAQAASTFRYDPGNPVPTVGGNMSSLVGLQPRPPGAPDLPVEERERDVIGIPGAFDQREDPRFIGSRPPYLPLASRADVLVFQTNPLPADTEVTGPVTVTVFVSSTAVDTDITAKLIDVYPASADYPDGFAMNLTDSIQRLRYRDGRSSHLLEPGGIYEVSFPLYPTANLFKAGHRIRLDVSSSNYPRFDVNPNTGAPLWSNGLLEPAINSVHHDRTHPSRITLPLIPTTP
jgi:predicted acyl esterase